MPQRPASICDGFLNMETVKHRSQRDVMLDALRVVAALSVLIFHFGFRGYSADGFETLHFASMSWFARYGYLGVELFFMISGYVIPLSIQGRRVRDFAVFRWIRLYPTYWMCAAVTTLIVHTVGDGRFRLPVHDVLLNTTMAAPWFGAAYIDGSYWSLAVELQFYVVVGILAWLFGSESLDWSLVGWMVGGIACIGLWKLTNIKLHFPAGRYFEYFCFGAGVFFFYRGSRRLPALMLMAGSLPLCIGESILSARDEAAHYHASFSHLALVAIVLGCALMVFLAPRVSIADGSKWTRVLIFAGGVTYPFYLIHQFIGYSLLNAFVKPEYRWVGLCGVAIAVTLLATAIYALFDVPVRKWLTAKYKTRLQSSAEKHRSAVVGA